ncbi:hypothetical protein SKAU_G00289670 [Synaphobranchus kaupii]|uniref:Reverse transcriptase zinc-binding domain-containing protein n=1 Tax=Synaphobranchus kaupii TaxID=118154 RepID=A0A9Q1ILY8_SYNKA|nr:hypothetical protein SKAU_G00289670 [Synaphobranchus kaupii]
MVGLRGLDGKIQTGAVEMVGVATEFYRGLFENRVVEEGVGKRFPGLVEERVPEEVRAALETPFNLEELRKALGGMKGGKVPGFLVGWDNKAPKAERVPAHLLWVVRWARRHEECADRDLVVDHRRLYKALREKLRPVGGLGVGVGRGVWAAVQPKGLDNRLKDLNWLIAYGRLPVRDVLYRHSLTQDRFCPRAGCRERETVQHVFWGCAFAQEVWGLVKGRYGVLEGLRQEGVIFGEGLGKKKGRDKFLAMLLMSVVKYKLWVARGEKGEVKQGWTARGVFQMVKGDVERRYGWEVLRWGFHAAWERWKALM